MFSQKKVLVVEDNLMNRSLLCHILESEYDVVEAENGQEALEVLKQYGEGISLILLDIVMPVMDGYTFLSIVKADSTYSSIPVIVTTQNEGESEEVAALSHGAADFVVKPYKPQIILHRAASIINLRETAAMINHIQYDRLTGLYSKEFFYQRVKEILLRHPDKHYDIVCSDVENFKLINDVMGVAAGDRLLCTIAEMYDQRMNGFGICGRLNSDRFACLLEHKWDYTRDMFELGNAYINEKMEMSNIVMKWGIYSIDDRTVSVEQMCDRALLAVKSIKGQYGKYFAAYDDTLRNQLLREQAITDSMETALAQNQFQIYMQPKYRISDESLVGAEALIRWIHPEWGFQSPGEFIPLFEKNGFITKLDQFVWDSVAATLHDWDERGYYPLSVSVNVSRADIYNADLAEMLTNIVEKHKIAPSRLHLEITESAYTENPRQIIDTVAHLRELGFVIEMDDFGSGYSSLNMINDLPIDVLKLDMKFIQSETAKPNSQGILKFIINLARWMKLSVTAEGVETKEQLDRLSEIGCDYVQGYYFAKPMPCKEFEALLKAPANREAEVSEEVEIAEYAQELPVLLVADEDEDYYMKLRHAFWEKYQVEQTCNKKETLDYIERCYEEIEAVVLCLTLPEDDGFSVLQTIQKDKKLRGLKVIATARPDPDLESKALGMGADDFICKPHYPQSLLRRLERINSAAACRNKVKQFQDIAYKDSLTKLLNRKGLDMALESLESRDMPLAVYIFDLDNLKVNNDACGHIKGDQLLKQFSTILRAHTREEDILARSGGDEFVAVMRRLSSGETAVRKGNEICRAVHMDEGEEAVSFSASAGVALMQPGDCFQDVLDRANKALYEAKCLTQGSCCMWKEEKI